MLKYNQLTIKLLEILLPRGSVAQEIQKPRVIYVRQ